MITIDFQINQNYLVYSLLRDRALSDADKAALQRIREFKNFAWEQDQEAYRLLSSGPSEHAILTKMNLQDIAKRSEVLLSKLVQNKTFLELQKETMQALDLIRAEWEKNQLKTHDIMSDLSGLELKGDHKVVVTHPALHQGINSNGIICWTNRNDWPNYNTIYIWHEILHSFLPCGDIEHAVIQFLSDNELRVRLNGGSYPPFEGHPELLELMGGGNDSCKIQPFCSLKAGWLIATA
ncbi:MAG: hypothetical protein K2X27_07225, partial [Candidatus Obscuribacterales bacterium]|nr:hypothetical protein [Candidatus Obscuribacterales bacterium]